MFGIEAYLMFPLLAHFVNFLAALFITVSTGTPDKGTGIDSTWVGKDNILLVHPRLLRAGMWLLVGGFFLQLILEFLEIYQKGGK